MNEPEPIIRNRPPFIACCTLILHQAAAIIAMFVISAWGSSLPAQTVDHGVPTMTSLDDLGEFLANYEKFSVDFTATVTYFDWHRRKLFVQADKEAIFVSGAQLDEAQRRKIDFGSRIHIVGNFHAADGCVRPTKLSLLDGRQAVAPLVVDAGELTKGAHWSRYVQLEGELVRVVQSNLHAQLVVRHGETKTICFVPGERSDMPSIWNVGSQIQVQGVLDWATYATGAPKHSICQVSNRQKVTVLSPSKTQDETKLAVDSIGLLEEIDDNVQVKLRGVVSFVSKGVGFLLEDGRDAVFIRYEESNMFSVGDNLSIEGTVIKKNQDTEISLSIVNAVNDIQKPWLAVRTTARQVVADDKYNRRVMLSGIITDIRSDGHHRELLLTSSGFQFRVFFQANDNQFNTLNLKENSQLLCTGMVQRASSTDDVWFTCEVHPDAIGSQVPAGILDKRLATMLGLGVLVLALVSGLWLLTMRLQVKRKTQHLADLTAKLRASYQATHEGILVLDTDGKIANVNSKFADISGLQLSVGERVSNLANRLNSRFDFPELVAFANAEPDDLLEPFKTEVTCQNTGRRTVIYASPIQDENGQRIGRLITMQDVTRQKELESHLLQSQKMEAVGRLAGGIAHDFNNLLQVMVFNVSLAKSTIATAPDEATECMESTELAVQRAARLVKNLLSLSRRSTLEVETVSLNDSVQRVVGMIHRTFPSTITIETDLEAELAACRIDENQIEQVLINVCLNARDAMPDGEGTITLKTSGFASDDGGVVRLRISDDGEGMDQETLTHIFEPFFTTKPNGQGTGLGMSMSYGIVEQLNGRISCDSKLGVGTAITIDLPAVELPATKEADSAVNMLAQRETSSGRLLVVDDEDAVRSATAKMASVLGWDVVEASDGQAALELVEDGDFNLVLLDYNMPGMSGKEVLYELSESKPDLPVIMCTGYAHDAVDLKDETAPPLRFLQKPFCTSDLEAACEGAVAAVG